MKQLKHFNLCTRILNQWPPYPKEYPLVEKIEGLIDDLLFFIETSPYN
ncbi:MAG: hypothetical protein ACPGLV_06715 [Bacteroidia bacterium]